jgi:hypothetical protein
VELIEDMGMKNVGNNTYRKRYGLFKCKCGKEVQRIMHNGKGAVNCGCDNSHLKKMRKDSNNKFFNNNYQNRL